MKRNVLNLKQKSDIIHCLEKGESVTALSKKYNIAKSTICAIRKNKSKILNVVENSYEVVTKKTLRCGEMPKVENKLYEWFCIQRKKNLPVTSDLIKEKAKLLNIKIKEKSSFCASDGWLQKFKRRYGIRFLKISGEKLSSSSHLVSPFKEQLRALIQQHYLTPDQIYNADESGLFWRMLTSKTLVQKEEKTAPGRKAEKAHLTFLACTNATGDHKIKPLVIGKAAKPRCFSNFKLPVDYKHSKNAWMTAAIFEDWFKYSFIPQVTNYLKSKDMPIKAILILDNAPCHPQATKLKSDDGNIFVVYMPPNVTPLIQPMDQNVIRITKLHYKSCLLASIVSSNCEDPGVLLKKLSIKDAIINLCLAWDKITPNIIKKCWLNILNSDEEFEIDDDIPLSVLRQEYRQDTAEPIMEISNLLSQLGDDYQSLINDICDDNDDVDDDDVSEDGVQISNEESDDAIHVVPKNSLKNTEVLDAFNKILVWGDENCSMEDMLVFRKYRDQLLATKINAKKTQTKLTTFF